MYKTAICVIVVAVGVYYLAYPYASGYCEYHGSKRLDGKTVLITGANSGIGKATALELAKRGARVICACRSIERGNAAVADIKRASGNDNIVMRKLDLASLKSVRQFVKVIEKEEKHLDILINNGAIGCRAFNKKTEDGFDDIIGVNHLGHFLLTNLLLNLLKNSQPSRVITVSSEGHRLAGDLDLDNLVDHQPTHICENYSRSKLANILFILELTSRLKNWNITANAVHPGTVHTGTLRSIDEGKDITSKVAKLVFDAFFWIFALDAHQGSQSVIYSAIDDSLQNISGKYITRCRIEEPSAAAKDEVTAKKLWEISEKLVKLENS